jgi:hypothetical protein
MKLQPTGAPSTEASGTLTCKGERAHSRTYIDIVPHTKHNTHPLVRATHCCKGHTHLQGQGGGGERVVEAQQQDVHK